MNAVDMAKLTSLDTPVENIIILVTFTDEKIAEMFSQIGVIRFVVKAKGPGVVQNSLGNPRQRKSVGVVIFFSMI